MYEAYAKVSIEETENNLGTGWLPPLPDLRDYTEDGADKPEMAKTLGIAAKKSNGIAHKSRFAAMVFANRKSTAIRIMHRSSGCWCG